MARTPLSENKKRRDLLKMRKPIIEQCTGCSHVTRDLIIEEGAELIADICKIFLYPDKKWRTMRCIKCTNPIEVSEVDKKKVNPLKASTKKYKTKK